MAGFRGPAAQSPKNTYAGVAGADLENAPTGSVPFNHIVNFPPSRIMANRRFSAPGNIPGNTDGVPGTPVARASGNPDVATQQAYTEKNPYGGSFGQGIAQFGSPRPLQQGQESAVRAPGNAPVGYSNDKLIAYDRHAIFKVGYENSGRDSGIVDQPVAGGPARPSMMLVQRTINYQQGTDETAATDDFSRDYTRNSTGMYVGEQGTGWSPVYGGTPGLYQEYGSYAGVSPSSPNISEGIHAPVQQGAQGDGPHSVWSGPPHGLHSPTLPTYSQTLGRYMSIPQMQRPRIDRPSNSPIAGQSYSQTVQSQGASGARATQSRFGGARFNQRSASNGWRGRAAG